MTQMNHTSHADRHEYRTVVFRDQSRDIKFLTRSTRPSEHSTTWEDGKIYPVIDVDAPTVRRGRLAEARG